MKETGTQNKLAGEKSPYLLQHADNPVNWYPWGEEAFSKARDENRPIFLSIGYSTCHWCHVMAHESFEDPEVARLLNQSFVNIKVDREERPDIDKFYMDVCVNMTGSGGWPLTIIMTPEKKPFFAATYIPKETRYGMAGIKELVHRISDIWTHQRSRVETTAEKIIQVLQENSMGMDGTLSASGKDNRQGKGERPGSNNAPGQQVNLEDVIHDVHDIFGRNGDDIFQRAYLTFTRTFDPEYGGFGNAPKFPSPHDLQFLMTHHQRTGDPQSLGMVTKTLDSMRSGGIYDHIGYGFHRYSTDRKWLVPHFEKMLYDQAMLLMAYTDAYQITGSNEYRRTILEIIEYISGTMTSPLGGFYSAEDADSEGKEGKFYLWAEEEIRDILTETDADIAMKVFNVNISGNFTDPVSRDRSGENILHMTCPLHEYAREFGMELDELGRIMNRIRLALLEVRDARIHPHKDDKVLTDWNGLMIAALARAGWVLAQKYVQEEEKKNRRNDGIQAIALARKAFDFTWDTMRTSEGTLLHRYRDGDAAIAGNLDDHAFMIRAALELYRSTFDVDYLEKALELNDVVLQQFLDTEHCGFFFTMRDNELPVRRKEFRDAAIPSGNSVQLGNLMMLSSITAREDLESHAHKMIQAFSAEILQVPHAQTCFLQGLELAVNGTREIIIVGDENSLDSREMLSTVRQTYLPDSIVVFISQNNDNACLYRLAPYLEHYRMVGGKATAYVCKNYSCQKPVNDPDSLKELLTSMVAT